MTFGAVSAHQVAAVGDDVKYFAVGHLHDPLVVEIGHDRHRANLLGDSVAIGPRTVAGRAIDREPLLAAPSNSAVIGSGLVSTKFVVPVTSAGVHRGIFERKHCAFRRLQRRAAGDRARQPAIAS